MTLFGSGAPVVAVDVGGTDMKVAVVDADGSVVDVQRVPTPRSATDPAGVVVDAVVSAYEAARARHPQVRIGALGVGVPGHVDEATGTGVFSANLGWRDAPLRDLLAARVDVPVAFGHDVRAAGTAEHELGAARGFRDVVVLAIGTGIAGVVFVDGRAHTAGGAAGELGHTLADPAGEPCSCGAVGCLETIASAGAIARRYAARTGSVVRGAREVLEAAGSGDAIAVAVWGEAIEALAEHIARLAAVLAPEAVVIGGGLAEAGDALLTPLAHRVDALLSFHRRPRLLQAALGEDAGVLGVALAARAVVEA